MIDAKIAQLRAKNAEIDKRKQVLTDVLLSFFVYFVVVHFLGGCCID